MLVRTAGFTDQSRTLLRRFKDLEALLDQLTVVGLNYDGSWKTHGTAEKLRAWAWLWKPVQASPELSPPSDRFTCT